MGDGDIIMIDATLDENKVLVEKYNIKGFPTIIKGNNTKYTGDRKSEDIVAFKNEK